MIMKEALFNMYVCSINVKSHTNHALKIAALKALQQRFHISDIKCSLILIFIYECIGIYDNYICLIYMISYLNIECDIKWALAHICKYICDIKFIF